MNENEIIYTKKSPEFERVRFVALAAACDACRPVLQMLRMVDGVLTGCDGYRVHKAKIDNLDNGLYEIKKLTKAKIILETVDDIGIEDYPHTSQFKPIVDESDIVFKGKVNIPNSMTFSAINAYCVVDNFCVNYEYLVSAVENTYEVTIYKISECSSAYLVKTDLGEAVIMCIDRNNFRKANI